MPLELVASDTATKFSFGITWSHEKYSIRLWSWISCSKSLIGFMVPPARITERVSLSISSKHIFGFRRRNLIVDLLVVSMLSKMRPSYDGVLRAFINCLICIRGHFITRSSSSPFWSSFLFSDVSFSFSFSLSFLLLIFSWKPISLNKVS